MVRIFLVLAVVLGLSACSAPIADLQEPTEPLGDFQVAHIITVAPNLKKLLVSHDVTEEEWIEKFDVAMKERFERFEGGKNYHLGISLEGYSVPPKVVPGKSVLALRVTVWDDAAQAKMNEETELVTVYRVFESSFLRQRDKQIDYLVQTAAYEIEQWMREMQAEEGWFGPVEQAAEPAVDTDSAES